MKFRHLTQFPSACSKMENTPVFKARESIGSMRLLTIKPFECDTSYLPNLVKLVFVRDR